MEHASKVHIILHLFRSKFDKPTSFIIDTLVGCDSLNWIDVITYTASNNTAIGVLALGANTTGSTNVAIGRKTMCTNTTGSNNTAVGTECMKLNTSGTQNAAFGKAAQLRDPSFKAKYKGSD